jgi:hypothetical protein
MGGPPETEFLGFSTFAGNRSISKQANGNRGFRANQGQSAVQEYQFYFKYLSAV